MMTGSSGEPERALLALPPRSSRVMTAVGPERAAYQEACCLAGNAEKYPTGMIKEDGAIVKCGLPCCTLGIIKPKVLIAEEGKCLCMRGAGAFPFNDKVTGPVCAVCFLRCLPGPPGCMKPVYEGGAPPTQEMAR